MVLPTQDLAGKAAIVTGGTRGIGRAIALNLASQGASILGTGSSPESLHHFDSLKAEVDQLFRESGTAAPQVIGISANTLSIDSPTAIADAIKEHFNGRVNVLVNNAAYGEPRTMGTFDSEYVQRILTGNIYHLVMTVEILFQRGYLQPNSRVINISSVSGRKLPYPGLLLGAATKATMEALTRFWADVLATHPSTEGTTVNALLVGATATERLLKFAPEELKQRAAGVLQSNRGILGPNGMGRSEDVANVAGLIASDQACWITGGVVHANGGNMNGS